MMPRVTPMLLIERFRQHCRRSNFFHLGLARPGAFGLAMGHLEELSRAQGPQRALVTNLDSGTDSACQVLTPVTGCDQSGDLTSLSPSVLICVMGVTAGIYLPGPLGRLNALVYERS